MTNTPKNDELRRVAQEKYLIATDFLFEVGPLFVQLNTGGREVWAPQTTEQIIKLYKKIKKYQNANEWAMRGKPAPNHMEHSQLKSLVERVREAKQSSKPNFEDMDDYNRTFLEAMYRGSDKKFEDALETILKEMGIHE